MSEQNTSHAYIKPELETTSRTVWSEEYFASTDGTVQTADRQVTMTRTGGGQWTVTLNPPHPSGTDYHVSFVAEEQSVVRDTPDVTIVQGTKTTSGFEFQITTGDNGGNSDTYVDTPVSIGIDAPVEIITAVVFAGQGQGVLSSGQLVVDNFQDGNGNAPFNLQVRNTTGSPISWKVVVTDVPYATIAGLTSGAYTLVTTDTSLYAHTFTGTTPLGAYSNITITGGTPSPTGVCVMSKKYYFRDGPLVDGAPSRVEYEVAELSDLTESPWDNPDGTSADQSSLNLQYTSGNVAVGNYGSSLGNQSTFQGASLVAGERHLQTSWVYAHALEAPNEKSAGSTAVIVGEDGNFNPSTDIVSLVTNGQTRLRASANGSIVYPSYGGAAFNSNAPTKILAVNADGTMVQVDPDSLAGDFTVIDNIDLQSTGNPNEFTVVVSWTDGGGTVHTTTDLTTIQITDSESPWDNSDGTPAGQSSNDIHYSAGFVGVGKVPEYGLHIADSSIVAKEFTSSAGGVTQYLQRSNDGTGNFHEYWNTEGTTAPKRIAAGYALNKEYTGNSEWYQVRGAGSDAAGTDIIWTPMHYSSMNTGQHWFPTYGDGTFDSANPARLLGVSGSGVIVEVDPDTIGSNTDEQQLSKVNTSPQSVTVVLTDGGSVQLSVSTTTQPVYEYRDIWAEEGSAVTAGSAEWSFGNGATGYMGLPIDAGWEVEAMYFSADTYAATASVSVDLMNYGNTPSNAAANTIVSISLSSATDGGGGTNNGYKYEVLPTPVPVPVTGTTTLIGFITRTVSGSVGDARVGARLRRKVADVVTGVSLL